MTRTSWYAAPAAAAGSAFASLAAAALVLSACTATRQAENTTSDGSPPVVVPSSGQAQRSTPSTPAPVTPSEQALEAAYSTPVEDPYYPKTSNPQIDTLHYNLALRWDRTVLTGTATVIFRAMATTNSLRLDISPQLNVSDVAIDAKAIAYIQTGDNLVMAVIHVAKGSQHTLTIDYSGAPATAPAPSGRGDLRGGLGWSRDPEGNVYTFQEPYGAYTWYPVNDHPSDKALYDVQVTVPRGEVAVFNGTLEGEQPAGPDATTWRWHLDEPAASYLTTIAIGDYSAYHQTMPDGTPATYWLLPQDRQLLQTLKSESRRAFTWLESRLGSYPFSTFGVVVVGGQSGMETQSMVTLSRGALERPDAVLEHEMAHQWFGDAVTPTDWRGLWLNEGWAMYLQQWYEHDTGRYEYAGGITRWRALDNAARARSGPPGDYDPTSFGDVNVYLGPALMLDRIRQRVGDRRFEELARAWVVEHEYGNVDRAEFVHWLDVKTGQSFSRLVDLWLDAPTTPR